jgi:hypothetical protein
MRVRRMRNSGVVPGLAAVALLLGSGAARADIIYQTGFEPPTYTVGTLNGQNGWGDDSPGATASQVETSTVFSGSQAISVSLDSTTDVTHALAYDSTTNPAALVKLQIAFQVQGNTLNQAEGLSVFGDGGFVAQIYALNGDFHFGTATAAGTLPLELGEWYSLEMDLDFQTQSVTAYVDGTFLATLAMGSPTTSLVDLDLGGSSGGFPGETVFYDDFSATVATAAPEPSSLALIAMGGVSLTGWRRWKTRRAAR